MLLHRRLSRLRLAALVLFAAAMSGCMGGSIARQIASSIAMQVADKAVGQALDQPDPLQQQQGSTNQLLVNNSIGLDPYQEAFLRAELVVPTPPPPKPAAPPQPDPAESASAQVTQLATVEIWSLLLGDEKRSMLENIRQLGIMQLPPEQNWDQWQLAEGGLAGDSGRPLLILVPPELGKLRSGNHAVIELGEANGLYVAKDRLD